MKSLDLAVERVPGWSAARKADRAEVLALLGELLRDCERAARIWQEYLDSPGAPGDVFSLVTWMGAARVKALHEVHLDARQRVYRICELADPKLARLVLLEDDLIEMAFRGLKQGETGPEAARTAVEIMNGRATHLRALADRIRSTPPRAGAAKGAARPAARTGKKPAKPVKKKTVAKKKVKKKIESKNKKKPSEKKGQKKAKKR
jgi:hypothetical protein